jgi:hypothetical protein
MVLGASLADTAQAQDSVRIGVLNDQSGVFATYQGIGSVIAAQMAVEDYGGKAAGKNVEVIGADHQIRLILVFPLQGAGTRTKTSLRSSICQTRRSRLQ